MSNLLDLSLARRPGIYVSSTGLPYASITYTLVRSSPVFFETWIQLMLILPALVIVAQKILWFSSRVVRGTIIAMLEGRTCAY